MKQVTLLFILVIYLLSCSGPKEISSAKVSPAMDTAAYFQNPYVAKYRYSPGFMMPDVAINYIEEFRFHKNRLTGKKLLRIAWTLFDQPTLKRIISDPDTDSIAFYLAAFPKTKSPNSDYEKMPFVILQAKQKVQQPPHSFMNSSIRSSVFSSLSSPIISFINAALNSGMSSKEAPSEISPKTPGVIFLKPPPNQICPPPKPGCSVLFDPNGNLISH